MGIEIEFLTFSTFVFGILMLVCFKPLQSTYLAKEVIQNKITEKERYRKQQAFSKELEDITSDFEYKYSEALRGELNK